MEPKAKERLNRAESVLLRSDKLFKTLSQVEEACKTVSVSPRLVLKVDVELMSEPLFETLSQVEEARVAESVKPKLVLAVEVEVKSDRLLALSNTAPVVA